MLLDRENISYPLYPQEDVEIVDNLCTLPEKRKSVNIFTELLKIFFYILCIKNIDERTLVCYINVAMD